MTPPLAAEWLAAEWLEAYGDGGFASSTVSGIRTRRYHALLLVARTPPTGRIVLVNGFEATLATPAGEYPLSTQHYAPDVVYPRGCDALTGFTAHPWPCWTFTLADGTRIEHECVADQTGRGVVLAWRRTAGTGAATLTIRPLLSGRDYHALMHENPAFDFTSRVAGGNAGWHPYAGLPAILAASNGRYAAAPDWYRNFLYTEEAARGLDCREDLASPGLFTFDLAAGEAVLVLSAADDAAADFAAALRIDAVATAGRVRADESVRRGALTPVERAADAFVVRRADGHTLVAGYPWFTDWGRDTFIAMRGLVLGRGHRQVAASILDAWAATVSEGMLPNRFPDAGGTPEYNAVDASLWFVVVVHEYLALAAASPTPPAAALRDRLLRAVHAILVGYAAGTRFRIRMDVDGLLACGEPGVQLTWMDAKVGDRVITPRVGKPVEVQALWINALRLAGGRYAPLAQRAEAAFRARFWNEAAGCLYDVVDADHVAGRADAAVRPNQIFAVGGLPHPVVEDARARAIVARVERELVTPMGVRTLAPWDPAYRPHYAGDVAARDRAYHEGTVWPWLIGPFVDAWLKVHGDADAQRAEARARFLPTLGRHLSGAGFGHLPEIADGDAPHAARGCPFQAWSLGEYLRAWTRTAPRSAEDTAPGTPAPPR